MSPPSKRVAFSTIAIANKKKIVERERMRKNIIIMVFKVSFVIIINLFSCSAAAADVEVSRRWRKKKKIGVSEGNRTIICPNTKPIYIHIQTCCHLLVIMEIREFSLSSIFQSIESTQKSCSNNFLFFFDIVL